MPLPDVETIGKLLSIPAILALPWYVGIPGLVIAFWLCWSAFGALLSLRIGRSVTRLFLAILLVVILSHGGQTIVQMLGVEEKSSPTRPQTAN